MTPDAGSAILSPGIGRDARGDPDGPRVLDVMSGPKKILLLIVGALAALLVVSQFVMGMLIIQGGSPKIRTAHQHSGYATAVVALIYIVWSMMTLASLPSRPKE